MALSGHSHSFPGVTGLTLEGFGVPNEDQLTLHTPDGRPVHGPGRGRWYSAATPRGQGRGRTTRW